MKNKRIIIIDSPVICGSNVEILTDAEIDYLKDLICQQDDSHELVYNLTKKLGCYLTKED